MVRRSRGIARLQHAKATIYPSTPCSHHDRMVSLRGTILSYNSPASPLDRCHNNHTTNHTPPNTWLSGSSCTCSSTRQQQTKRKRDGTAPHADLTPAAPEPADASPGAPVETIASRSVAASSSGTGPPLSGGGTYWSAPERKAAVGTEAMWPKRACLSSKVRSALNMSSSPSWNGQTGVRDGRCGAVGPGEHLRFLLQILNGHVCMHCSAVLCDYCIAVRSSTPVLPASAANGAPSAAATVAAVTLHENGHPSARMSGGMVYGKDDR